MIEMVQVINFMKYKIANKCLGAFTHTLCIVEITCYYTRNVFAICMYTVCNIWLYQECYTVLNVLPGILKDLGQQKKKC